MSSGLRFSAVKKLGVGVDGAKRDWLQSSRRFVIKVPDPRNSVHGT
jgi:hypothetical protein